MALAWAAGPGRLELPVIERFPALRTPGEFHHHLHLGHEHLVSGRNRVRISAAGTAAKVEKIWIRLFS